MDQDKIYEDTSENKEFEWLLHIKNEALPTAFSYARFSKSIEEMTGFGKKQSLNLPSLANKCFNSLRNETDAPFYTYNDEYIHYFVRQSIKGGIYGSFNQ